MLLIPHCSTNKHDDDHETKPAHSAHDEEIFSNAKPSGEKKPGSAGIHVNMPSMAECTQEEKPCRASSTGDAEEKQGIAGNDEKEPASAGDSGMESGFTGNDEKEPASAGIGDMTPNITGNDDKDPANAGNGDTTPSIAGNAEN